MSTTTTMLAGVLVLAFGVLGTAKLAAVPAMRERATHLGFSADAYRGIGALEILAVAGILVGAAAPAVGLVAGVGLIVLLVGALVAHVRNGDGVKEFAPAVILALVALAFVILMGGHLS